MLELTDEPILVIRQRKCQGAIGVHAGDHGGEDQQIEHRQESQRQADGITLDNEEEHRDPDIVPSLHQADRKPCRRHAGRSRRGDQDQHDAHLIDRITGFEEYETLASKGDDKRAQAPDERPDDLTGILVEPAIGQKAARGREPQ